MTDEVEHERREPDGYRWRFTAGADRTWRHCATMPGFDPLIVECEPLQLVSAAQAEVASLQEALEIALTYSEPGRRGAIRAAIDAAKTRGKRDPSPTETP